MSVTQIQYHILFPRTQSFFRANDVTFSINHIRSRRPSIMEFRFHCFDMQNKEIKVDGNGAIVDSSSQAYSNANIVYTADRWVIGTVYEHREASFDISDDVLEATAYVQIELVTMGVDSENPLYFTEVMLQEEDFSEYHQPREVIESYLVGFNNNLYANLYTDDGEYLQVIRPNKESIHTNMLDKAEVTILAPHFAEEDEYDDDVAVFIEAMNQREQTIDVLR